MFDTLREDGRPLIMGILNVTPDSFSDGGRHARMDAAVAHACHLVEEGADIIDVGGESTRPGSLDVDTNEQRARVVPVVRELARQLPGRIALSVDTRSPQVARAALDVGARIINDINAARQPGMLELVASSDCGLVLMHMQGTPRTMQRQPSYGDVVAEVRQFLAQRVAACRTFGIDAARLVVDPGIGFGKNREHNLRLLAALPEFANLGCSVLIGTSRKRFMGGLCNETEFSELIGATCATTAMGVAAGVRIFRVHDVKPNRQAADVAWACLRHAAGDVCE